MPLYVIFILVFSAIFLGMPVAFAFILGTASYLALDGGFPVAVVASRMGPALDSFPFLAIPLFIFAGNLLSRSGIARRIFDFANSAVGHIPGGLGHVNVLASIVFAGMSGVAQADAAGLGRIELEEMERAGYEKPFSAAITAASATIGPIIPPSTMMVIYAVLAGVPLDKLFLAGVLPGLVLGLFLMVAVYLLVKLEKVKAPILPRQPWSIRFKTFFRAFPALCVPGFLVFGLLKGIATPTELGALTCLFAVILWIIYGEFSLKKLLDCSIQTAKTTGILAILIICATPFIWTMSVENFGSVVSNIFNSISSNPLVFLLILNLVLLFLGSILETSVIIMIVVPIIAPIALLYGIDPLHFALIVIVNILLGTLTPPFGLLLFVMMDLTGLSLHEITKAVMPFYIPMLAFLIVITLIPEITTFIPNLAQLIGG